MREVGLRCRNEQLPQLEANRRGGQIEPQAHPGAHGVTTFSTRLRGFDIIEVAVSSSRGGAIGVPTDLEHR